MKPGLSKAAVAAGDTTMRGLLRRRLEIADMLDQVIEELGVQYGELVKIQAEIGGGLIKAAPPGRDNLFLPSWITESRTAEVLRNRLAMELTEHSQGRGNSSILGPVTARESIVEVFTRDSAGIEKTAPPRPAAPPREETGASGKPPYRLSELGGLRPRGGGSLDGSRKKVGGEGL